MTNTLKNVTVTVRTAVFSFEGLKLTRGHPTHPLSANVRTAVFSFEGLKQVGIRTKFLALPVRTAVFSFEGLKH